MRIAIVSQFNSPGGGARFLRALSLGLLNQPQVSEIGLFIDAESASRDGFVALLPDSERLTVHLMDSRGDFLDSTVRTPAGAARRLREWARKQPAIVRAYRLVRYRALQSTPVASLPRVTLSDRVTETVSTFDVAYFPWPRQVLPPASPPALVATFHDFNHRHHFGNYREQDIDLLDAEMVEWLSGRVQPVSSTRFIAAELDTYYPMRTNEPEVVYLSTFAIHNPTPDEVAAVVGHFRLPQGYALCPTNIGPHKNLSSLLRAAGRLKRGGTPVRLVLTGSGTQCLGVDPRKDPLYASIFKEPIDELNRLIAEEHLVVGEDIWPLGYVTDKQMDALVRGAALVVAPSRYEAGSGPALDAWWLGTAVVSSSLAPVVEQIEFLGTEALLFEPTDIDQMSDVIAEALSNPERMQAMATRSLDAIARYTWDDVAAGYVRVFQKALRRESQTERSGDSLLEAQVATRLLDRVMLDDASFARYCASLSGYAKDSERLRRTLRVRKAIKRLPFVGRIASALHRRLRGRDS